MDKGSSKDYMKWPASKDDNIKVMRWVGDEIIHTHCHDYIEIAFLAQGTCIHEYHNEKVKLIPGDIFIITPNEEHSYEITSKTVIYNCLFYPEALGEDWDKLKKVSGIYDLLIIEPFYRLETGHQEVLHLISSEIDTIISILDTMLVEQENRLDGSELIQKANLVRFLCVLGRIWKMKFSSRFNLYCSRRNMLAEAIAFIEQNIKENIKIESVASKSYLSPNYFRRIFKEITGLTPIEYINSLRISKARQLLEKGKSSITEVGEAVGIPDSNYFAKIFKSATNMSPSEYKKKFRNY